MSETSNGSVTIRRTGDYAVSYELTALAKIAAKTRKMPDAFIADKAADVTEEFRRYLTPLLGREMPVVHRLRDQAVPKISAPP